MVKFQYGKDTFEVPTGSGFKEIYILLGKQMLFGYIILLFIFITISAVFTVTSLVQGDGEGLFISLSIPMFMSLMLLMTIPFLMLTILIPAVLVSRLVKEGNRTYVDNGRIVVYHQNWSMSPIIKNVIPISSVSHVLKADESYWRERWKNTRLAWKILRLHPLPPKGGLHPMYSTRKHLLIIFLKHPVKITNMNLGVWTRMGLTVKEYWVREVIIDVNPDSQDYFIDEVITRI
ncbi:MAG: hypothetical protein ACMUIE_10500 [Thermoplasmatota archaeon]